MTRQRYLVRVRYFPRQETPTLVLAGADAGLICLSAWFRELASGGYRKLLLKREPWVHLARDTSVAVAVEERPLGPIAEVNGNWKLLWGITPAQAERFAVQVHKLLEGARAGHVLLDNGADEAVRVLVSLNEYEPRHFRVTMM